MKRTPVKMIFTKTIFVLVLLSGFLCGLPAGHAVEPGEMLKDPVLEQRARNISRDLRCLVCQGQDIDDSNAELAADIRKLVRERLTAGDTDAQVFAYIQSRYGDYVLMRPPVQADTYLLWFAPLLVLGAGLGVAWVYMRHQQPAGAAGED